MLLSGIGIGLGTIVAAIGFLVFITILSLIAWAIGFLSVSLLVAGMVGAGFALAASVIGLLLQPKDNLPGRVA